MKSIPDLNNIKIKIILFCSIQILFFSQAWAADPPTVNGLYYGDQDSSRYNFWRSGNDGRSKVYYYLDNSTQILC